MLRSCPRCARAAAPHVRFCGVMPNALPGVGQRPTRCLERGGAPRQQRATADAAIAAEFLVEPVRALPALGRGRLGCRAARRRGRSQPAGGSATPASCSRSSPSTRCSTSSLFVGLVRGVADRLVPRPRAPLRAARGARSARAAVVISVGAVVLYLLTNVLLSPAAAIKPGLPGAYQLGQLFGGGNAFVPGVAAAPLLLGLVLFAVLLVDEYLVQWLVHTCFRRDRFVTDPRHRQSTADPVQVTLRTLGVSSFHRELERVAAADRAGHVEGGADVVVHRNSQPVRRCSRGQDRRRTVRPRRRQGRRTNGSRRCGRHARGDQRRPGSHQGSVLAGAEPAAERPRDARAGSRAVRAARDAWWRLPAARDPSVARPSAGHLGRPPAGRCLAEEPVEWARYYRCYQVETWDRDLTASCYVHIGTDQTILYLERVHCLVPPLAAHFRRIDEPPNHLEPIGNALVALFLLPASVLRRLHTVFGSFRRLPQGAGEVVPDRYGAARSLRELASSDRVPDVLPERGTRPRYQGIVDSVLTRAVGKYLEDHGYSVVEFQEAVAPVFQNFHNASVNNSSIGPNARTYNSQPDGTKEKP